MARALPSLVVAALLADAPVLAQSLEQRVDAAPSGVVRMSFAARDDVCGYGTNVHSFGARADRNWRPGECDNGPVRVQLAKEGARVTALDTYVGGVWQTLPNVTDLGDVAAAQAVDFLLDIAATAAPDVAEDAIMPAAIAGAPDPWERLLALARNGSLSGDVREQAIFWLGQSASREATAGLTALAEGDETTKVQRAAVFALSQRDDPERIDQLIRVARTHRNPQVVEAAFFWLAESEDERAIALFEEVLAR
jgi:hypothetical protein